MMETATVELREFREKYRVRPGRSAVRPGDRVLIATRSGLETGTVRSVDKTPEGPEKKEAPEMKIIRKLNRDDYRVLEENIKLSEKIRPEVEAEIESSSLNMSLARVSYTYDRQKLFVYYTAPERVDFRDLIKKLGSRLKIRVQMVQIGVRDETALKGGIGLCGRVVCCREFLKAMETVNIDMARNQQLSLNPENISGCCGRLMCCLRFENTYYEETHRKMPAPGKKVLTPDGRGEVVDINHVNRSVSVRLKSGLVSQFRVEELSSGMKDRLKKWMK